MKSSIKDFFCKYQVRSFLWIWSHLLEKSLMEDFIFCVAEYKLNTSLELPPKWFLKDYSTRF